MESEFYKIKKERDELKKEIEEAKKRFKICFKIKQIKRS